MTRGVDHVLPLSADLANQISDRPDFTSDQTTNSRSPNSPRVASAATRRSHRRTPYQVPWVAIDRGKCEVLSGQKVIATSRFNWPNSAAFAWGLSSHVS